MKIIESSVEVIEEKDPYKMIELAGRTCYKSEDKITEDSAKEFVDRMIKLQHLAMLEHGTVYLRVSDKDINYHVYLNRYEKNPYSRCIYGLTLNGAPVGDLCITTNYRVLVENGWSNDLKYQCDPTPSHERRITAKFICDRSASHQIVRHRSMSFAQESQRYCNYSKDKFNKEITFIKPTWLDIPTGNYTYWDGDWCNIDNDIDNMKIHLPSDNGIADNFLRCLNNAESQYKLLLDKGLKPQEARGILPNATKTEIVVTGFESDWAHFFSLRRSKAAHPDMQKLANELYDKLYGEGKEE